MGYTEPPPPRVSKALHERLFLSPWPASAWYNLLGHIRGNNVNDLPTPFSSGSCFLHCARELEAQKNQHSSLWIRAGRVTWEGQSESFPEHQGNLSHFKKDAEIRSGESGHKPGPRLPVCAREPGRLRASQQMATPVPCHPGPPRCHPVEAPHPSPPQATSVTVGLVVPSFWADNGGPIVPLAPLLSSRNTAAGAEACTPECTRYLPF